MNKHCQISQWVWTFNRNCKLRIRKQNRHEFFTNIRFNIELTASILDTICQVHACVFEVVCRKDIVWVKPVCV